ncbi:ANTAR domain-containing protein [Arthrobacter sp. Z1-15]
MDKPMDTVLFPLRVQELLLENPDLENFLAPLAVLLTERLREWNVAGSSLMIVRSRRQPVQVGSEPGFIELERGTHAEDPSRRALAHQAPAVARNLDGEDQRSAYWTAARASGMSAAASVPVAVPDPDLAVLTCYSSSPGAFGPAALAALESAAAELATPLALALRLDAQTHRARNLQAALESRTVVDLAAGIIMAQNNCSQQGAVEILRSVSNSRNVKVRDVAAGVVAVVSDRVSTHFEE